MQDKMENMNGKQKRGAPELESRRKFIKSSACLGTLGVSGLLSSAALLGNASAKASTADAADPTAADGPPDDSEVRAFQAYDIREMTARQHLNETLVLPAQETNGDDLRYAGQKFYASFTKTLPHNRFGEVNPSAYRALLLAQSTGEARDFADIRLDPRADRTLANPQGGYRFIYTGLDGHATRMRPAPSFRSAESAAEMGELYWQALTRDVPFSRYDRSAEIASAVYDLNNNFSETVGPKDESGNVTPATLFRGPTPGDLTGPYLSQFLWKDVPYGPSVIEQRYETPLASVNFMLDEGNWLNVQRGGTPQENITFEPGFYLYDNRSLGEYVHRDVLFQAYFSAGLILLGYGAAAIDPNNPYFNGDITNQVAFTSLGAPYMIDLVTQAGNLALQGAWYQKWLVHRRLRPEVFGGRVHFLMTDQRTYEIHPDILNSEAIQEAYIQNNGTYFLPMAYTEGSPTHPSYPAGHATVAGACTTTLKAFFNTDFVIPDPVVANDDGTDLLTYTGTDLTVGGELNKLASNIAIGRNAAGVHYRSDGVDGLLVGEQQAIALLRDYSRALNEDFAGFNLTKFDGTPIVIRDGQIHIL